MPPTMDFESQVNVASMVGTWAATMITAFGIITIVRQLRGAVSMMLSGRDRLKRRAGSYIACIPKTINMHNGNYEAELPSLLGWAQHQYLNDKSIAVVQEEVTSGRPEPGTSSWSKLFSRCGITPSDLIKHGGRAATMFPATERSRDEARPVAQADMIIADGRVLYGFATEEFTLLVILAGFALNTFTPTGTHESEDFLGILRIAESAQFQQFALYDPHVGIKVVPNPTEGGPHMVPVRQCLDLALGIIVTGHQAHRQPYIILPNHVEPSDAAAAWTEDPRQLHEIRRLVENLTLESGSKYISYGINPTELETFRRRVHPHGPAGAAAADARPVFVIGLALASLTPWALLALLPPQLKALAAPLEFLAAAAVPPADFLATRIEERKLQLADGWHDRAERAAALRKLGDVHAAAFRRSSNFCSWYYCAMADEFAAAGLGFAAVRAALAAHVVADAVGARDDAGVVAAAMAYFHDARAPGPGDEKAPGGVPRWAVVVYARYLWAWLHDSLPADFTTRRFRRRVFLG